jgi:hypothetical protein
MEKNCTNTVPVKVESVQKLTPDILATRPYILYFYIISKSYFKYSVYYFKRLPLVLNMRTILFYCPYCKSIVIPQVTFLNQPVYLSNVFVFYVKYLQT